VTVLRAPADLYANRFSSVQITVQYRYIFVLLVGRYSLQLNNKREVLAQGCSEEVSV